MRYLICVLVSIGLTVGILNAQEVLHFKKPQYTWVKCNCPNPSNPNWPPVLGLSQGDFIKHQMYVQALEYVVQDECRGSFNFVND